MTNAIIASFESYNQHRYGTPWVCSMSEDGKHNFEVKVGTYTGDSHNGESGDLVVFEPVEGMVYAYGQKDYRSNKSLREFALWDGTKFVSCDKLGRIK